MVKKEKPEKSYNIKVPVYTTTMLDQNVGRKRHFVGRNVGRNKQT